MFCTLPENNVLHRQCSSVALHHQNNEQGFSNNKIVSGGIQVGRNKDCIKSLFYKIF